MGASNGGRSGDWATLLQPVNTLKFEKERN
jgi:hypothetical protein